MKGFLMVIRDLTGSNMFEVGQAGDMKPFEEKSDAVDLARGSRAGSSGNAPLENYFIVNEKGETVWEHPKNYPNHK